MVLKNLLTDERGRSTTEMDELFGKRSKRQMQHVDRQENKRILTKSDRYGECSQAVFSFSRLFLEGGS